MPPAPVDLGPGVLAAFTTRADGNLAQHVGADPDETAEHLDRLERWCGAPVVFGRQVHGTRAATVGHAGTGIRDGDGIGQDEDGVDALVTDGPAVGLGVLVADCVPVLLADPVARVVATAHAGRVGLLCGVLRNVLAVMCERGAEPGRIRAVLGPAAGPCCYEVPADMAREAVATLPQLAATTSWGTPALDLRAGCRAVLAGAGVRAVDLVGGCTIEDPTLFSHRASQRSGPHGHRRGRPTGRFAGVVRLLP